MTLWSLNQTAENPSLTPPWTVLGTRRRHWSAGSRSPNLAEGSSYVQQVPSDRLQEGPI